MSCVLESATLSFPACSLRCSLTVSDAAQAAATHDADTVRHNAEHHARMHGLDYMERTHGETVEYAWSVPTCRQCYC